MIYPKNPFCPMNDSECQCPGGGNNVNNNTGGNNMGGNNMGGNNMGGNNMGGNNMGGNNGMGNGSGSNLGRDDMLRRIMELEFTLTDLHLYLDTHPDDEEALEMFTKLSAMLKSLMYDYSQKFEPLTAFDSKNKTPFQWVKTPWPWQV